MKIIIKYLFNRYLLHSRVIRYYQRQTKNYNAEKSEIVNDFDSIESVSSKWEKIISMVKWRKDPLWQLGDAITDPFKSIMEGRDDCDGFASIAAVILGKKFKYRGIEFEFDGLYFSFYKKVGFKFSGHCIGVWRSTDFLLAISSSEFKLFKNSKDLFEYCMNDKLYYIVKCDVSDGPIFDVTLNKVISGKELNINLLKKN